MISFHFFDAVCIGFKYDSIHSTYHDCVINTKILMFDIGVFQLIDWIRQIIEQENELVWVGAPPPRPSPSQTLAFVLIYFILSEHPVAFQGPLCYWWRDLLFGRNLPSPTSALPWCRSSLISRAAVGSTAACRFDGNWIWYRIVACMEANNGLCSFLCPCTIRETQLNNLVQ